MTSKERVKMLLVKENMTLKELAFNLSKKMNKEISLQNLSKKLSRNSLKLQEFEYILEILNYRLYIEKID